MRVVARHTLIRHQIGVRVAQYLFSVLFFVAGYRLSGISIDLLPSLLGEDIGERIFPYASVEGVGAVDQDIRSEAFFETLSKFKAQSEVRGMVLIFAKNAFFEKVVVVAVIDLALGLTDMARAQGDDGFVQEVGVLNGRHPHGVLGYVGQAVDRDNQPDRRQYEQNDGRVVGETADVFEIVSVGHD